MTCHSSTLLCNAPPAGTKLPSLKQALKDAHTARSEAVKRAEHESMRAAAFKADAAAIQAQLLAERVRSEAWAAEREREVREERERWEAARDALDCACVQHTVDAAMQRAVSGAQVGVVTSAPCGPGTAVCHAW